MPAFKLAEHAALSDVGREREGNEDSFVASPPLFAVADGMGGAQAGEVASKIVAETLAAALDGGELPEGLAGALEQANERIHLMARDDRSLAGMGTTGTAAWLGTSMITIAHVGDSRAYRLREGRLEQLTDDHSLVGGLVRMGELTPAEAERHPQRSVILRAIGVAPTVEVDLAEHVLVDGDVFLLCSDGLSGMVRDEVIEEILEMRTPLAKAAEMLIELANASGGRDNITAVLLRVAQD